VRFRWFRVFPEHLRHQVLPQVLWGPRRLARLRLDKNSLELRTLGRALKSVRPWFVFKYSVFNAGVDNFCALCYWLPMKIQFPMLVVGAFTLFTALAFADSPGLVNQLSSDQTTIYTASVYPTVSVRLLITAADASRGVIYLTADQREQRRIIIVGDYVYDHTGAPFTLTNNNSDEFNYVMDDAGNFYWLDEATDPTIRHDSIFDKGPVAGGGNITIVNSRITCIDSDSGHYPTGALFQNVLNQLMKDGAVVTDFKTVATDNSNPIFHVPSKTICN
jgi:hypothetical protein